MIQSKAELEFYIAADRIMNGYSQSYSFKDLLDRFLGSGLIVRYLRAMRYCAYYNNTSKTKWSIHTILKYYWLSIFNRLSLKLGFSIGINSLGYGVTIPHFGTIVINSDARIGNFSVIHTCTCVAGGDKIIGDYFYFSTGAQIK